MDRAGRIAARAAKTIDFSDPAARSAAVVDVSLEFAARIVPAGVRDVESYLFISIKRRLINWTRDERRAARRSRIDVRGGMQREDRLPQRCVITDAEQRSRVKAYLDRSLARTGSWESSDVEMVQRTIRVIRAALVGEG